MLKRWLRSPLVVTVLFAVAAGLILFGGIRGAQAALRIQSEWFGAEVVLDDIDVALTEQSGREEKARLVHGEESLLSQVKDGKLVFLGDDDEFAIGRKYVEKLAVRNTRNSKNNAGGADGNAEDQLIKEYVRVTVYKYWEKKNSKGTYVKDPSLDSKYIKVEWNTNDSGWAIDDLSTTDERTILYYDSIVKAVNESDDPSEDTEPFTKSIRIDSTILDADNLEDYRDARFKIEAVVDAVQTHNGKDAMMSAWGNNLIAVGDDAEN